MVLTPSDSTERQPGKRYFFSHQVISDDNYPVSSQISGSLLSKSGRSCLAPASPKIWKNSEYSGSRTICIDTVSKNKS